MLETQVQNTVKQIEDAFAGVILGDGVSLKEAEELDGSGGWTIPEDFAAERQGAEVEDWTRIPDEEIEMCSSAMIFMDLEGRRFHIPAYMRFTLERYEESESCTTDFTVGRLCGEGDILQLKPLLSAAQIDAIVQFLRTVDAMDEDLDEDIPFAIHLWQRDDETSREEENEARKQFEEAWINREKDIRLARSQRRERKQQQEKERQERRKRNLFRLLLVAHVLILFGILGAFVYFQRNAVGTWWIAGVGAIAVGFIAFVVGIYRHDDRFEEDPRSS